MTPEEIKETVETYFNIDLRDKKRKRVVVYPKSILCFVLREKTRLSTSKIAKVVGYKSRQVVLHHEANVRSRINIYKGLKKDLEEIENLLNNGTK